MCCSDHRLHPHSAHLSHFCCHYRNQSPDSNFDMNTIARNGTLVHQRMEKTASDRCLMIVLALKVEKESNNAFDGSATGRLPVTSESCED